MKNFMVNPFFYYGVSFCFVFILYLFKWSNLYLPISFSLTFFIFTTVFISFIFCLFYNKIISFKKENLIDKVEKRKVYILLFLLSMSLIAEFLYHGLVPIYLVVKGVNYDYTQFGIPVFHVFLLSYVTLLGVIYFYRFLVYGDKYYLSIFLFSLVFCFLIVNRGSLIFIFLAALIGYASHNFNFSKILKILLSIFCIIFVFGILGNLRMSSSGYQEKDIILKIGQASDSYLNLNLPSGTFWTYLYLTSPYGNLENEVAKREYNYKYDFDNYIIFEFIPDFISKRIGTQNTSSNLLTEELNVNTMYGGSIKKMGFIGAFGIFIWYILSIMITAKLVNKNFFIPAMILLSTLSIMLVFSNVLIFSGFIFQFLILILFSHFKFKQITLL